MSLIPSFSKIPNFRSSFLELQREDETQGGLEDPLLIPLKKLRQCLRDLSSKTKGFLGLLRILKEFSLNSLIGSPKAYFANLWYFI